VIREIHERIDRDIRLLLKLYVHDISGGDKTITFIKTRGK